jgi:hypothetical protein
MVGIGLGEHHRLQDSKTLAHLSQAYSRGKTFAVDGLVIADDL